jgi:sterol desaturase/sphingolipid hydroxylase (fatty acid hydroxylase superfamily)
MSELIPCMAILAFFVPLFALIVIMRYISYRETLALAEKGLVRPPKRSNDGKDALRWGIAITAVGLALCVGLWPLGFLAGNTFPLGLGPWMLIGFVPTFFGLALILIYVLTYDRQKPQPPRPDSTADLPEA